MFLNVRRTGHKSNIIPRTPAFARLSSEVLELLPEGGPGLAEMAANEKIRVTCGLFIQDPVAVRYVTGQYAGLEIPFQEVP